MINQDQGRYADAPAVTVRLEGGPANFPEELRTARVSRLDQTVKVEYLGGYEHFRRDERGDGTRVFHWAGRTRIAE